MGSTANTFFKASILLAILGALYACADGEGVNFALFSERAGAYSPWTR